MSIEKTHIGTTSIKSNAAKQAERIESRCRYKADAHTKASSMWTLAHYVLSIPLVILSAIIGLAALNKILGNHQTIVGVLAIAISMLAALVAFLNPNEKSKNHHLASIEYDALKNKAYHLRTIEVVRLTSAQDISNRMQDLINKKQELDKRSPAVKKLSPRAIAAMKRLREMIYGAKGKKRRSSDGE